VTNTHFEFRIHWPFDFYGLGSGEYSEWFKDGEFGKDHFFRREFNALRQRPNEFWIESREVGPICVSMNGDQILSFFSDRFDEEGILSSVMGEK